MTDNELRKLAVYIVDELTKPTEDYNEKLGYHLVFFDQNQFDEYEVLQLNHVIKQLNELLEDSITHEHYETSSIILKKIKTIEEERDKLIENKKTK